MEIRNLHHNNVPCTVTERVKKVWELAQEHLVCIFVLFTVRRTVETIQVTETLLYTVRASNT